MQAGPSRAQLPTRAQRLLGIAALGLAYWAVARLGFTFGTLKGNVSPVWPPAGLALAAVFLWGRWIAPGIFIGEYLANRNGLPTLSVLGMSTGNVLEALIGVYLLHRLKVDRNLSRPRDVGALMALAASATFLSAAIGNVSLWLGGVFPLSDLWQQSRVWWTGDALGVLLVAPLVLTWTSKTKATVRGTQHEIAALATATVAASWVALNGPRPSAFLLYPVVAWAALRFGGRGASVTVLFLATVTVYRTADGAGPFSSGDFMTDLWLLDAFVFVLAAQGMLLSSVMHDRDHSQRQLEETNAELEARVADRTAELRTDRARLEQAQQIAHIGSWEWDAMSDSMTASREMQRLYDIDAERQHLPISVYLDRIHRDDKRRARDAILEARETGMVFDFVHRVVQPNGDMRFIRMQGHSDVVRGVVVRINGIAQDVTEARLAEEAIRIGEERTSRIVDAASEAFVSMDLNGRLTDWNRQAELTFGWARDEVIGRRMAEIIVPPQFRGAHHAGISRFLATGTMHVLNKRTEITAMHRDGHEFPVEIAIWATEGAYGETNFHAFMHDISERQATKAQLASALDEAREASRSKSAFLANMSHEIRTPMNGVLGMVGLLLDTPLDAQQLDYVQTMATSAEALLGIIDDILDVSKIEAGKLTLDNGDFSLRRLVQDTISPFMPAVDSKGIELSAYLAGDIPEVINGDRLRLRQVMSNLVSNAVKFTSIGSVELRVTRSNENGIDTLFFEVLDRGVGIPANAGSYLFDPFVQADPSTTRRYGGTGLGLAICRQLVTLMEGEIGADSREDGGSRFWFTLPLVRATGALPASERRQVIASPAKVKGGKILVVEDNAVNRKVAVGMLEQLGYTADVAEDGAMAVDMFTPGLYEAILMDCQMPRMDGYDATTAIRALEPSGRTPIIAMTASAMASDRERCLTVGMDEYLSKPINRDLLATVLRDLAPRETTEGNRKHMNENDTSGMNDDAFDAETLEQLRSLDSDGTFIAELVTMFRDDIASHVGTLKDAIARHDEQTIARTAHQAKGASANLGMRALAGALKTLELSAASTEDELADAMLVVEAKVAEALEYVNTMVAA